MNIISKPYKDGIIYTAYFSIEDVKQKLSKFYEDPNTSEDAFIEIIEQHLNFEPTGNEFKGFI